jgi:hypothetical protein
MVDRPQRFSRRQVVAGTSLLVVGPTARSVLAQGPGGEKIRLLATELVTTSEQVEDVRIAAEVRRRYVERIRYLATQRGNPRDRREIIDRELAIYSELLGVQHALGGPSGWFPV